MPLPAEYILVCATPIDPPVDGDIWAFHVVNDSDQPLHVVLEHVDYEWGEMGGGSAPNRSFGPIAPKTAVEIWRDDDNAAELRTDLRVVIRGADEARRLTVEFGKLGRKEPTTLLATLGTKAVVGNHLDNGSVAIEAPPPPPPTLWQRITGLFRGKPRAPGIEIDDVGARRPLGDGRVEAVRWADLAKAEVMTTDEGPAADDIFWVLHGSDGKGCVVPHSADPDGRILKRLQALPGFDNKVFIESMSSAGNARFIVWKKPPA